MGVIGFGLHNLGNRYFWTDESSTFFASLGWPALGEPPGAISTAWYWSINGFLDPGIFHMLVRFWATLTGSDPLTLRVLPFFFFIVYLVAIIGLARLGGAPLFVGAGVAGVMMLENITPYYSIELRPYSAGLATVVVLTIATLWLIKSPSVRRLLIFVFTAMFFGSMQYNSMPITWAMALVLVLAWWQEKNSLKRMVLLFASVFVFLWQPFLFFVTRGNPLQSTGGKSLDYIPDLVLTNMPQDRLLEVVFSNLFSPTALPRTLFILVIPILWWRGRLSRKFVNIDWSIRFVNYLWLVVVISTLSTVLLSLLGFIPWILGTRWSIAEVGLIALSLIGLMALVVRSTFWSKRWSVAVTGIVLVMASLLGASRLWTYERPNDIDVMSTFAAVILSGKQGGTVIDVWSYPTIRYSMEYSGSHDALLAQWITHDISSTSTFDEANAVDIQMFLESDSDRMMLRSESVLTDSGIQVPDNVQIVRYEPQPEDGTVSIDLPVLLVKS